VIDNQRVLELPLTARNSQQLIILAGGAVGDGTQAANNNYPVTLISVAGAQTDAVTYVLDGGTHNENYIHSALPSPFPDALQEFRVESSAAPARYGSAGGVVEMVTKSGTNHFHGTSSLSVPGPVLSEEFSTPCGPKRRFSSRRSVPSQDRDRRS